MVASKGVDTSQSSPLLEQLIRTLAPVFAAYRAIAVAYLFGSVARGEARPESDLDVGLVYPQRGGAEHPRIASELAAQLGRASGREAIDVVDLEAQGPIFCHRVLCEGRLIHVADAARRVDFESETIVRALDFRPTYDLATQGKPAALRRWLGERYDLRTGSVKA
jgi:predicted nucleotidyltransferase